MISFVWQPGLKQKFVEALTLFSTNPYEPRLKIHKLSGKLKDYWAFAVDYDTRIVFKFISEQEVLLIDIGSHDEVY